MVGVLKAARCEVFEQMLEGGGYIVAVRGMSRNTGEVEHVHVTCEKVRRGARMGSWAGPG